LYTAGWVLIKEKNEIQNEVQNEVKTRYGKSPASTHMDFGPQAANLPFLGSLVAKQ
jgi:pyruvate/oxaloacetate carboxyltransferase